MVVDAQHTVKLIDFEMSQFCKDANGNIVQAWPLVTLLGKRAYWPPELWDNILQNLQHTRIYYPFAKDVWALGVLMFYMVTGHFLFAVIGPSVHHPWLMLFATRTEDEIAGLFRTHFGTDYSEGLVPLIGLFRRVFEVDPTRRITAREMLTFLV